MDTEKHVIVGRVGAPHGVQGWIKINAYTDPAANIIDYVPWQIHHRNTWQTIALEDVKTQHTGILAKFVGCDDRDKAKTYTNAEIGIDKSQMPTLPQGEYYWTDLEGLTVINSGNHTLGVIDHLFATGANDVILVKGEQEYLIPYVMGEVIEDIDLKNNVMRVNWDPDY